MPRRNEQGPKREIKYRTEDGCMWLTVVPQDWPEDCWPEICAFRAGRPFGRLYALEEIGEKLTLVEAG